MKNYFGFTLVELMTVVAVIAILSVISIPAYNDYLIRGRIPEATSGLSSARIQMEQFFQDNRTYNDSGAGGICGSTQPYAIGSFFSFSGSNCSDTGYTLTATGIGPMVGFSFSVDQANSQSSTVIGISGWVGNTGCWITRKGGEC